MRQLVALLGGLLLSALFVLPAHAVPLAFTIQPTTKYANGNPLPATGPGSITLHRVQYGTCVIEGDVVSFGAVLGETVVAMPVVTGSFDVPMGVYCLRAYPSNRYGEGKKPYPVWIIGPVPSADGAISASSLGQ